MSEWIKHDGKSCPIPPETICCIRTRAGSESAPEWRTDASDWEWIWQEFGGEEDPAGDILEYKVINA